jgi:hypothetical protein
VLKRIFLFVCLTFSLGANAAYLVESSTGVATGIGNLSVDGALYNVDFEALGDTFSTFGGVEQFWADESSAANAVTAITDFLTGQNVYSINNWTVATLGFEGFGAWFPTDGAAFTAGPGDWSPVVIGESYAASGDYAGTAWSVASVPLLAAAWLFGSALLGLGVVKRKKA